MGAECGKAIYCSLWVQRLSLGWGLFEQSSEVGSHEAQLPPIDGWQVQDQRAANALLYVAILALQVQSN